MPVKSEDKQGNQSRLEGTRRKGVEDKGKGRDHTLSSKSRMTFTLKKQCQEGKSDQLCQMLQIGQVR